MITIDNTQFPIVFVRYGSVNEEDLSDFLLRLEPVYQRGHLAIIADATQASISDATAERRRILAEGLKKIVDKYPNHVISEAVILSNPLVRGILTAVNWVRDPKSFPHKAFKNEAEAVAWTKEQIRAARQLS